LYWKYQYVRARYASACRRSDKGISKVWQKAHADLEQAVSRVCYEETLVQAAHSQSFEGHVPYLLNSAKGTHAPNASDSSFVRSAQSPHSWHELAAYGKTDNPLGESFEDEIEDEEDDSVPPNERMTWEEFYARICAFEKKFLAQRASRNLVAPSVPAIVGATAK